MNIPFLSRRRPGDSCLQCGAPFESSAELVSVRRGTRFLVDINATRAWRRCSSCGVAELLGNDTARALVREVLVRAHPEIISSRGEVSLGAVEVDLVDRDTAPAPTSASGAVSLLTRARARVRLIRRVDAAFFVIAIGIGSLHGVRGAASMLVLLALIVAIESLGKAIETFKTSRASSTVRGLLSVCVVLAVIAVAPGFTDLAWLTPWVTIGMVIGLTVIARITDPWIRRLIRPSRGNAVSRAWLDEATITLPVGPGAILLRGVDGREYLGPAAVNVLLHSTAADIAKLSAEAAANAAELGQRYRTPAALATQLRSIRPEDAGVFVWGELPPVWRAALLLTLLDTRDRPTRNDQTLDVGELNRIATLPTHWVPIEAQTLAPETHTHAYQRRNGTLHSRDSAVRRDTTPRTGQLGKHCSRP